MTTPKVSILIPCYNSEAFIGETLRCCLNQSYGNLEIIVVDDGSIDNSVQIVRQLLKEDIRIKLFTQKNAGACCARNYAFSECSGDYIMYLDADDLMSPNKVETQANVLNQNPDVDVVTCKWDRFQNSIEDSTFPTYNCYHDYSRGIDLLVDLWTSGEMFAVTCYLVRRNVIENAGTWKENLKKNQDGEFFSRVLLHSRKITFNSDALFYYRTGAYDSVSKGNTKAKVESMLDSFVMYKKILEFEDSQRTREALATNFALFRYLYNGAYSDLSIRAKEEISSLGVKHPIVGTERIKKIAKVIGFENFLRLRKLCLKR